MVIIHWRFALWSNVQERPICQQQCQKSILRRFKCWTILLYSSWFWAKISLSVGIKSRIQRDHHQKLGWSEILYFPLTILFLSQIDSVRLVYAHLVADSGITFKINIMQNKIPTSQKYRTTVPENAREGVYCSHINNEANFFQHFCSLGIKSKQRPNYQKNNSHTLLYKTSSVLWEIIHFQLNGHQITTTFLKIMYFFLFLMLVMSLTFNQCLLLLKANKAYFLKCYH